MADLPKRVVIDGGQLETPTQNGGFQSQRSFVQRLIEVTVRLTPNQQSGQPNKFAGTDSDTVTFSGFRTQVRIQNSGGVQARAQVIIYGMNPSTMNQLSTLGQIFNMTQKNSITIAAGDSKGLTPVFSGTIVQAFGNYSELPAASMRFECMTGFIDGILPVAASSYPQSTDVATIMSGFARQLVTADGNAAGFENNGVNVQLPAGSYYSGTLRDQIRRVAHDANINADVLPGSGGNQVLAIWPIGGSRTSLNSQNIPLINKNTGMILTPSFGPNGYAIVRTLFNPLVSLGAVVRVQSEVVPQVDRDWVVYNLGMTLDAFVPKGRWEQSMACYPKGFSAPVPPQVG